jgi:hypothetical protein
MEYVEPNAKLIAKMQDYLHEHKIESRLYNCLRAEFQSICMQYPYTLNRITQYNAEIQWEMSMKEYLPRNTEGMNLDYIHDLLHQDGDVISAKQLYFEICTAPIKRAEENSSLRSLDGMKSFVLISKLREQIEYYPCEYVFDKVFSDKRFEREIENSLSGILTETDNMSEQKILAHIEYADILKQISQYYWQNALNLLGQYTAIFGMQLEENPYQNYIEEKINKIIYGKLSDKLKRYCDVYNILFTGYGSFIGLRSGGRYQNIRYVRARKQKAFL